MGAYEAVDAINLAIARVRAHWPALAAADEILIAKAIDGCFDASDAPAWLALCEAIFWERYEAWPARSRPPRSEVWEHCWRYLPSKMSALLVASKKIEETEGGIAIAQAYQRPRTSGWVFSVSPQLYNAEARRHYMVTPLLDPLDYIGRAWSWNAATGTEMYKDQRRDVTYHSQRVDDLIGLMLAVQ